MVPRKMVIDNIECLQNELDVVDVWRIQNPQSRSYTWSQKSPPIFCRLDYWLVSNNFRDFVNSTDVIPTIKTDHVAIELNFAVSNQTDAAKRPGFWKMNVSLLEDKNYLEELKHNIPHLRTTGTESLLDKRCVWDWLKYNIRNHAILYSKKKAKERSAKEKKLTTCIRGSNEKVPPRNSRKLL